MLAVPESMPCTPMIASDMNDDDPAERALWIENERGSRERAEHHAAVEHRATRARGASRTRWSEMMPANMPPVMPATHEQHAPVARRRSRRLMPVAFANVGYHWMIALRRKPLQNSMSAMIRIAGLLQHLLQRPATAAGRSPSSPRRRVAEVEVRVAGLARRVADEEEVQHREDRRGSPPGRRTPTGGRAPGRSARSSRTRSRGRARSGCRRCRRTCRARAGGTTPR